MLVLLLRLTRCWATMLPLISATALMFPSSSRRATCAPSPSHLERGSMIAEVGYQDYEVEGWFGLFAAAKTSKETVSDLAGWFTAAMQVPDVRAKLAAIGLYPMEMCGADFGALIRKQYEEYGRVIREVNFKAQ